MVELFMGEVKPFYGKWNWPIRDMEPGQYFVVDRDRRSAEAVRSYVSMAGVRVGKYFSINANDPDRPGFCRVTCTKPPTERGLDDAKRDLLVLDYGKANEKMLKWYGVELGQDLPWNNFTTGERGFIEAKQLQSPPYKRMFVMTDVEGNFGLVLKPDGVEFYPFPKGATPRQWVYAPTLEEVMQ